MGIKRPAFANASHRLITIGTSIQHSNVFLTSLPPSEWVRWRDRIHIHHFRAGELISPQGASATYAYFPVNCLIAITLKGPDQEEIQIAYIGRTGVFGLSPNASAPTDEARIIRPGSAYRITRAWIQAEIETSATLRTFLHAYWHVQLEQSQRDLFCSRHHSLREQFCRLILSLIDMIAEDVIDFTQTDFALTMGIQRETINAIAKDLKNNRVIAYSRGQLRVLDRSKLETKACVCYEKQKRNFKVTPATK